MMINPGPSDLIRIDGMAAPCIIGIFPEERARVQPLILDFEATLDATATAMTRDLSRSIDYAALARELAFILEAGRFQLLETAGLTLCQYVFARAPAAVRVRIALTKPEALGGRGAPTVVIERLAPTQRSEDGHVSQTPDATIDIVDTRSQSSMRQDWPKRSELQISCDLKLVVSTP